MGSSQVIVEAIQQHDSMPQHGSGRIPSANPGFPRHCAPELRPVPTTVEQSDRFQTGFQIYARVAEKFLHLA